MSRQKEKRRSRSGKPEIKLHVLGAAGGVTGSLNLFEYIEQDQVTRFLLDTGLTVENESADFQNRLPHGVTPKDINFVIISHAHIDHSGYLPKLVKDGFKGKVFTTAATCDLLQFMLPDSGFLQEEAAKAKNKRAEKAAQDKAQRSELKSAQKAPSARSQGRKQAARKQTATAAKPQHQPLYTQDDAKKALAHLAALSFDERHELAPDVFVTFTQAGHILGAAVVNLEIGAGQYKRTFCFTGNVGRDNVPLLRKLEKVAGADYLMTESTYGNKLHLRRDRLEVLSGVINRAYERAKTPHPKFGHGVIIIPAFAVGRAQIVLSDLRELMAQKRIPTLPVFIDSPMTIRSTAVHRKHAALMNEETAALMAQGVDPFTTPRQAECMQWTDSQHLHEPQREPVIIIGSSGMASGGRIVQHLKERLPGAQHTVVFVGYQGTGTLGQALVGKLRENAETNTAPKTVRIAGASVPVRATVEFMSDYSAHADFADLLRWMLKFERRPKMTFLVHGDADALEGLSNHIEHTLGWNVTIPKAKETFEL